MEVMASKNVASTSQSSSSVELLFSLGVNVDIPDNEGMTPLVFAIKEGNIGIVTQLLNGGADPSRCDYRGKTALHYAIKHCAGSVELLLSNGIDANTPDNERVTPLMIAIKEDKIEIATQLLNGGADPSRCDYRGETALHYAIKYSAGSVELLLSNGVDANTPDNERITPLMIAIKEDKIEILTQLLNGGADPSRCDYRGETALHYAIKYSAGSVELLLSNGVDANTPDNERVTPLMIAIKEDNIEIVKQLLNGGAQPLRADRRGETSLHYAARYSARSVELLLSNGVNIDVIRLWTDLKDRRSPLMAAAHAGNLTTLLLLLNNGADVNLRSGDFQTPLHFAESGRVVEILWEWGADINVWDMNGKTPLHSATIREKLDVVEALLSLGPPPSNYRLFIRRTYLPLLINGVCRIMMKYKHVYYNRINYIALLKIPYFYDTNNFAKQCSLEVERVKAARFGRLSLFHMLNRDLTDCTFAANAELCEFIEDERLEEDFPLYHTILRRRLRFAKRRHCLLINGLVDKFTLMLKGNFQNVLLPEEVCHLILTQISTADMIRLYRTLDRDFVIDDEAEDKLQH